MLIFHRGAPRIEDAEPCLARNLRRGKVPRRRANLSRFIEYGSTAKKFNLLRRKFSRNWSTVLGNWCRLLKVCSFPTQVWCGLSLSLITNPQGLQIVSFVDTWLDFFKFHQFSRCSFFSPWIEASVCQFMNVGASLCLSFLIFSCPKR